MVSVMLYLCIVCVALLMDLFVLCVACLTVCVNCLVKECAESYLLLTSYACCTTTGRDDVLVEQLNNVDPTVHRWLLTMLNKWFIENKIPNIWIHYVSRQSKIIAIPKVYRTISLLYHKYKLYKKMILNTITTTIEQHLIKEEADFTPGKLTCLLHTTQ